MSTFLDFVQIENDLAAPFSSSLLFRRHIMTTSDKNLQKKIQIQIKQSRKYSYHAIARSVGQLCALCRDAFWNGAPCPVVANLVRIWGKKCWFCSKKENNAFCTLPDWPGVANLIITSLLVRDWFRTRKRQILGFETKNRSSSKEHTHVFNRLYSKDKECSPLSCWWSAGTVQGIAHGLFGCDLRHRHQHIIIIIIVIIIITSLLLNYISLWSRFGI